MTSASTRLGSSPSLTTFPAEILFIVFQWIDDHALLNLALTCRRLRSVFLSEYLDRHNIPYPSSTNMTIATDSDYSALPMIGAIYPLHVLDALTLWFHHGFGDLMYRQLDAARLFICRSAYIRACNIYVPNITRKATEASVVQFILSLNGLLGALDGKLHRRLCIDASNHPLLYEKLPSSSCRLTARPLRSLSEIRIRGDIMSWPWGIDWIIQTLNSSPITQLHLTEVSLIARDQTRTVACLRRFALPKLLVLEVVG